MHIAKPTPPDVKLPLPKWEIDRIHHHRDVLENLMEKSNELALVLQQELLRDAATREKASAAAEENQPRPQPKPAPKPNPTTTDDTSAQKPQAPHHNYQFHPDRLFKTLVWAVQSCIRLDAWLADRLYQAHTTAELAGLNHPNRQDILNDLHNSARTADPHAERINMHLNLERRVSEELGLFPDRNPGDIIGDLANIFDIPFDDADFPNNWRCETFIPPEPESAELPEDEDERIKEYIRLKELDRRYHRRE